MIETASQGKLTPYALVFCRKSSRLKHLLLGQKLNGTL